MIVQKVVCERCNVETVAEPGIPIISASIGLGGGPKDFCSVECCCQYLKSADVGLECKKIKDSVAEKRAAEQGLIDAGIDPSKVQSMHLSK